MVETYTLNKCTRLKKRAEKLIYPKSDEAEKLCEEVKDLVYTTLPNYVYIKLLKDVDFKKMPGQEIDRDKWYQNKNLMTWVLQDIQKNTIVAEKESRKNLKANQLVLLTTLLFASIILWTMDKTLNWEWLHHHPKKIPMNSCVELMLCVTSYKMYSKRRFPFWEILFSLIVALLAML